MLAETLLEVRALKIVNAKKILSPAHKRKAVALLVEEEGYPVRRACRYLRLHRSTFQYRLQRPQEKHARLIERLTALSWKHPRYGYRRIVALFAPGRLDGEQKAGVQRLRRWVGLKVQVTRKSACVVAVPPPAGWNGRRIATRSGAGTLSMIAPTTEEP